MRLDQERPYERIRAARFIDDGRAVAIESFTKTSHTLIERPCAEIGAALDHQACRFAARVRIDDADRGMHPVPLFKLADGLQAPNRPKPWPPEKLWSIRTAND